MMRFRRLACSFCLALLLLLCLAGQAGAQADAPATATPEALRIIKVDPPNWFAGLPKPMLLLRGSGFRGAAFTLSDPALGLERTTISANGHWAQLWLRSSPTKPETIQITARVGREKTSAPFAFAAARKPNDGMNGFSALDVMYLILTDRFADGDLANDGPDAHSAASSPAATAERAKPRGWHGGDLRGIGDHLDYLQSLGATAVWPTPVYQNHAPEAYHGYHATDYYAVDEHYGTLAELQALATSLHGRGMKLVLDTVPNHVGPLHPWVTDEPTPTWFHGTAAQHIEAQFNFYALINPHAPERDRDATLHGWFVNQLPDMNTDDPTVSAYLRQNVVWWIEETGADALRIDTFPYVDRAFWHDLHAELHTLFPRLTDVGEVSNGDPEVTSAFAAGVTRAGIDTGLYTPFDFPIYHAARAVFAGKEPLSRLAFILSQDELYPHPERLVPFLGNHDESRFAGAVPDPQERELAWAFLLTTRGTPQIYSGDELAMTGGDDPDNRRDFPGGFPGTASGFVPATRTPEAQTTFEQIRTLAKLRQTEPSLACGSEQVLASGPDLLVYARLGQMACTSVPAGTHARPMLVVLQRGAANPVHLDLRQTALSGCRPETPVLGRAAVAMEGQTLTLTPQSAVVILPCELVQAQP